MTLPDKPPRNEEDVLKRRLLGAAVLIALAVIILPLILDGSGSESRFQVVEEIRKEPPRIIDPNKKITVPEKSEILKTGSSTEETAIAAQSEDNSNGTAAGAQGTASVTESVSQKLDETADSVVSTTTNASITAEREIESVVGQSPESSAQSSAAESAANAVGESAGAQNTTTGQTNSDDSTSTPSDEVIDSVAWVIQAGSFTDEINALQARDQIRRAGYPSYVSQVENAGQFLYRVKVGPINNRRQVEQMQSEIENLLQQSTIIIRYQ